MRSNDVEEVSTHAFTRICMCMYMGARIYVLIALELLFLPTL